jgi:hypothetical protein
MNGDLHVMERFDRTGLEEAGKLSLMDRQDTKFAFARDLLPGMLTELTQPYFALDTGLGPVASYHNRYFDTADFAFYRDHHNGKRPRYKVRYRQYAAGNLCFLELKCKSNKGRTEKTRRMAAAFNPGLTAQELAWLKGNIPYGPQNLSAALDGHFDRITLLSREGKDRCTFDLNLRFERSGRVFSLPDLVIAEIKQERGSRANPVIQVLEQNRIRPMSLSKYCLGMLHLQPGLRHNRFKPKTRMLERITSITYA